MADENEAAEGEVKKGGGGGIMALVVPFVIALVTSIVVAGVFTFVLAPKSQPVEDEVDKALKAEGANQHEKTGQADSGKKETGIYHNLDPFIVSIFDREKVHYLKVVLSLELAEDGVKDDIGAKNPQIRDVVNFVLSDFTLRELLDNQAKNLLKEVMIKQLNKILGKGQIINVYFNEFTIQ